MNCPACTSPLEPRRIRERIEVDVCRACGGTWFDPGEFDELRTTLGGAGSQRASLRDRFQLAPTGDAQACPRCTTPTLLPGNVDDTWLTLCFECAGIFLTTAELQTLRHRAHEQQDNWLFGFLLLDDVFDAFDAADS